MRTSNSLRSLVVVAGAAMLLAVAAACGSETVEVPGETVVVEKVVTETVEVPGETVVVEKEVIKTVEVPGETVTKEVVKTVEVPGETVVVEKEVVKTVEVPGETVVQEVIKEVQVPGETVVVEKEVVKTVEVPGQTVVVEKEVVKEVETDRYVRNVWGELVEKPQYGGTIARAMPYSPPLAGWDPWHEASTMYLSPVFDYLAQVDWARSPAELDFSQVGWLTEDTVTGAVAESWEQPDPLTVIFHIRKGVYWHDKPPMNGRELTAYDAEFTFHRNLGLGEFAEAGPSPFILQMSGLPVESVTATDKWTLELKLHTPSLGAVEAFLFAGDEGAMIMPPEAVREHGDLRDWRNLVGYGPYEVTDVVPDSRTTYARNPNYWQYDPRHPNLDLRLPYADELEVFIIPDVSTRLAALRTGKIAIILGYAAMSLDEALSLQKTNPELVAVSTAANSANAPGFASDRPPFDDINVRIAMQKALNIEEVARTYYRGYADPTPFGTSPRGAVGYYIPYDEWPEEVKWQYQYDPADAERLLDEAGHPRGNDGIRFKTSIEIVPNWGMDIDLAQLATLYWDKIGVEVSVNVFEDETMYWPRMQSRTYEGMIGVDARHKQQEPLSALYGRFHSTDNWIGEEGGVWGVSDPTFDAIVEEMKVVSDRQEYMKLARQMDMYYVEQMWGLWGIPPAVDNFVMHQPWLKGYRGELGGSDGDYLGPVIYMWVDDELQKEMGH